MDNERKEEQYDSERPEQVESKKSLEEIAIQLETRRLSPNMVDKKMKRACIRFYMMKRDYSSRTIAEILHLGMRAVQRFTHRVKEENTMSVDLHWQKNIIGEFLNKCRAQSERLQRMLYAEGISLAEVMKITREQHQIEMNCLKVLERMGYLCKDRGTGDVNISIKEDNDRMQTLEDLTAVAEDARRKLEQEWEKYKTFQGSPEEKVKLYEFLKKREDVLNKRLDALEERKIEFSQDEDKKKYKYADMKWY